MGAKSTDAINRALVVKTNPVHIGLTGGIGSGKSTVAALLHKLGAAVVDADAISRAATAAGGAAICEIRTIFGHEFIGPGGALNREKMREVLFTDSSAKSKLESILHPFIRQQMFAQAETASAAGAACVVFDIPLLVESGAWRNFMDSVLVVDCTPETQLLRVKARSAISEDMILTIISAQASRNHRLAAADIVLFNDNCSMEQLASRVQAIALKIGL